VTKLLTLIFIISSLFIFGFNYNDRTVISKITPPKNWPKPNYNFENNPITEAGFKLGRKLFYDPGLSRNNTISCAHCHLQYTGFAHVDHRVSHGIDGKKGTRNAPALINLIWNTSFHWDGGVNHIELQPINPIEHPAEMDNSLINVLNYLNSSETYTALFFEAFNDSIVSSSSFLKALTQFTGSLISSNSKYDQYLKKDRSFTQQEENGLKLFKKNCNNCHTAPLFNSNRFENNGIPIDTLFNDLGRYKITNNPLDSLKFRVPTLRNIEFTFPYMHDGRYKTLRQVIDYYTEDINIKNPQLSPQLRKKIVLSSNEKKDLIAFLKTLTDKDFLYNKRFSFPR